MATRLPEEWRAPAAFAALCLGSLIYEAIHRSFWQRAHDTAPVAALLILALLVLLLRGSRFAWWVFTAFTGLGLVTWIVGMPNHADTAWIVGGLVGLVEFGLLISPGMRRFVGLRGRLSPSPG